MLECGFDSELSGAPLCNTVGTRHCHFAIAQYPKRVAAMKAQDFIALLGSMKTSNHNCQNQLCALVRRAVNLLHRVQSFQMIYYVQGHVLGLNLVTFAYGRTSWPAVKIVSLQVLPLGRGALLHMRPLQMHGAGVEQGCCVCCFCSICAP